MIGVDLFSGAGGDCEQTHRDFSPSRISSSIHPWAAASTVTIMVNLPPGFSRGFIGKSSLVSQALVELVGEHLAHSHIPDLGFGMRTAQFPCLTKRDAPGIGTERRYSEVECDPTKSIAHFSLAQVERLRLSASGERLVVALRDAFSVLVPS